MKKTYISPSMTAIVLNMQPLMTLSSGGDNPDTVVNHTPYNDKFSSRGFDFDDEDEDW